MAARLAMNDPAAKPAKRGPLTRLLIAATAGAAAAWLAGFGWFIYLITQPASSPRHADAIVVLTGGPDRVEVAFRLLADGAADRLLVSGVGEKTDLADLAHLAGIDPAPFEQQITLGYAARSTRGNAREIASWAREKGVGTLLVVTSWFHMPRALLELRLAMPAVAPQPYPVGRLDVAEFAHGSGARRVIGEYHKYLATLAWLAASPVMPAAWGAETAR
jgi:uncharacterized SAM-binding protein YcdF (DUF218 family)